MKSVILEHVSKKIRNKTIIDDVSLELEAGEIYSFFGRNASGKTMLFRAISGLIKVDSGKIEVCGERIDLGNTFPSSMGLIIENIGLWKQLTGFDNLKLLADIKKQIGKEEIINTMERVDLNPYDKRKYGSYSLGMKQKLAIAQAIMERPQIIILDEPTNSLDDNSIALFRNVILEEKRRGATCLIASHQKDDIRDLSIECYSIERGRCVKLRD